MHAARVMVFAILYRLIRLDASLYVRSLVLLALRLRYTPGGT